jgi:hypothetical protein
MPLAEGVTTDPSLARTFRGCPSGAAVVVSSPSSSRRYSPRVNISARRSATARSTRSSRVRAPGDRANRRIATACHLENGSHMIRSPQRLSCLIRRTLPSQEELASLENKYFRLTDVFESTIGSFWAISLLRCTHLLVRGWV